MSEDRYYKNKYKPCVDVEGYLKSWAGRKCGINITCNSASL